MGDGDQVNGVVTEENGGTEVAEAVPEQTEEASPEKTESAPEPTDAAPEQSEASENGQAEQSPGQEPEVTETEKPVEESNKNVKTVANILHKVKEDTEMSSEQKIDTLSMLLTKFVAENGV